MPGKPAQRRRQFWGSTAEWYAGYATLFLIGFFVAVTVLDYKIAFVLLLATLIAIAMSLYRWKRRNEHE